MALNISLLVIPWPIFLIALIVVVTVIIVLTSIEINLSRKAKQKKEAEETYYQRKLSAASALRADQNSFLIALDKIAREFFSEDAGMRMMGRYTELIGTLKTQNKLSEARFCEKMQEALYAGHMINQAILNNLHEEIRLFILRKEKANPTFETVRQETPASTTQSVVLQNNDVNEHILEYLNEGLRRGYNLKSLKVRLLQSGFDESDVNTAVNHLADKPRLTQTTEKKILTNFFNPKNKDLEIIKKGIEDKDEIGRAEIIEIVPYKKEIIEINAKKYPEKEPESYKYVQSLDDTRRVEDKIQKRKEELTVKGYKGAAKLG